jgi:ferrochelatase
VNATTTQVLLVGHGSVEIADDVPPFLVNIRRGRPASQELVAEVQRRYEAIGGRSPLLDISKSQAQKLAARLGVPVRLATRFWHPFVKDVLGEVLRSGCRELAVVALAPYSGHVYGREVERLLHEIAGQAVSPPRLSLAPNWGTEPALVTGFARALSGAVHALPAERAEAAHVVLSAHSLPEAIIRAGDPYQSEVEKTARAVVEAARISNPWRVAFQSQGASHEPWIGPDFRQTFEAIADEGGRDVIVCPIGFIADHVEILYDVDIEARSLAEIFGLSLTRTASLNDGPAILEALTSVATAAFDRVGVLS